MEEEDQLLERHRSYLVGRVDPDFGLIDHLRSSRTLSVEEANRIAAGKTTEARNRKLIECLVKRRKTAEFISALRENGQIHLVNYLNSNGVYRPEFADDWPLSSEYVNSLDENRRYLLEHVEPTELYNDLMAGRVISAWQRQFIESKPTYFDSNGALLDILRKCSVRQYMTTVESLNRTNQQHVAKLLLERKTNSSTNNGVVTDIAGHVSDHVTRSTGNAPSDSSNVHRVTDERSKQQQQQQQHLCFSCLNGGVSSETLKKQEHENSHKGELSIFISEDQVDGDVTRTAVVELGNVIEFERIKPNPISITWQQNFRKRTKKYFFVPFTVKGTAVRSYLAVEDGYWNAFVGMSRESPSSSSSPTDTHDDDSRRRNCVLVTKDFRYGQNNEATFRFLVLGDKEDGMYQHRFAMAFDNYSSQDQFQTFARTVGIVLDSCLKTNFTQIAETYIGSTLKEF